MKIGLNGQVIQISNPAGPEVYTINLFKNLARLDSENDYTIYLDRTPSKEFFNEITGGNPKFSFKVLEGEKLWTQHYLAKELIKNPVDVFFTAVHTIPMIRTGKTKFVVMIHGLEYKFTKGFKNPMKKLKIERPIRYAAKHSDKIIVPSKATKDEILKRRWGIKDEKIKIVYEGVSEEFYERTGDEIKKIREKYDLKDSPYLLFVSTIQPRKNLPSTIRAFSQFINENPEMKNTLLLIAGKNGWDYQESLEAPDKFGITENVKFIGRVPQEDLPALYSGSKGYINISYDEGFGLPLLESMACGIWSVVSDIPAHREVGGSLPIYADPYNIENIKDGIFKIMTSDFDKNLLLDRAAGFSWKRTAEKTLEILKETSK
jgi:glycosyltransferase involved in cell wall biosynthesis